MNRFAHLLSREQRPQASPGAKLQQAVRMQQTGISLYRAKLLREHSQLDETEREQLLKAWLLAEEPLDPPLRRHTAHGYFKR